MLESGKSVDNIIPWQEFDWVITPLDRDPSWELVTDTTQLQVRDAVRRNYHLTGGNFPRGFVAGIDGPTIYIWTEPAIFEDPDFMAIPLTQIVSNSHQSVYRIPHDN